ncbi:PREDICTED: bidirectional sugar transporter SWEET5-like [Ipomoea nil]|uniref:bidirectional sugar transporter SWEET5-like n=1 Tax=Ipomoea nil TaxID=35883 RepID=UPI0009010BE4|nr:PREDICTED: bidirectional sugar transporter SWEET5-like [Ipomoea nil]
MIFRELAHTVVGICGNVTALILFLAPVSTFVRICKNKSVMQFTVAPYLATLFNCGIWCLYSMPNVHPNSILVMTINGTGIAIELVYSIIFFIFSDKKKRLLIASVIFAEVVFMATLYTLDIHFAHTYELRATIIGSICVVGGILMYASPLAVMKTVIATKSVEYMPLFLSVCTFANALCWAAFALLRIDLFILITNGVGVLLGLAQLILYGIYCNNSNKSQRPEQPTFAVNSLHVSQFDLSSTTLTSKLNISVSAPNPNEKLHISGDIPVGTGSFSAFEHGTKNTTTLKTTISASKQTLAVKSHDLQR